MFLMLIGRPKAICGVLCSEPRNFYTREAKRPDILRNKAQLKIGSCLEEVGTVSLYYNDTASEAKGLMRNRLRKECWLRVNIIKAIIAAAL